MKSVARLRPDGLKGASNSNSLFYKLFNELIKKNPHVSSKSANIKIIVMLQ